MHDLRLAIQTHLMHALFSDRVARARDAFECAANTNGDDYLIGNLLNFRGKRKVYSSYTANVPNVISEDKIPEYYHKHLKRIDAIDKQQIRTSCAIKWLSNHFPDNMEFLTLLNQAYPLPLSEAAYAEFKVADNIIPDSATQEKLNVILEALAMKGM